jgi:hypothetical protein
MQEPLGAGRSQSIHNRNVSLKQMHLINEENTNREIKSEKQRMM